MYVFEMLNLLPDEVVFSVEWAEVYLLHLSDIDNSFDLIIKF